MIEINLQETMFNLSIFFAGVAVGAIVMAVVTDWGKK